MNISFKVLRCGSRTFFPFLQITCFKDPSKNYRVVNAPIGVLDDFDDVRVYARASEKAISRAIRVSLSFE